MAGAGPWGPTTAVRGVTLRFFDLYIVEKITQQTVLLRGMNSVSQTEWTH